jgi:PKD repeat protein
MIAKLFMKKQTVKRWIFRMALLVVMALPELASAQYFNYNLAGDVLAGFRKTGIYADHYELAVDLGSVTNFIKMPIGVTINISNFSPNQLTFAFPDGYNHLQWSMFACLASSGSSWVTPVGTFPKNTLWYTAPGTDVNTQTQPPTRLGSGIQKQVWGIMSGVGRSAYAISAGLGTTNADNNTVLIAESVATYPNDILSAYISDASDPSDGDFNPYGTGGLPSTIENITPNTFNAPQRTDFYQVCPTGSVDPITGLTNTTPYFVGYFLLNPSGTMTFTRAAAVVNNPPSAGTVFSAITNGFLPLTVVFTNTASGNITNWVWNFGNGIIITNFTGANVTNTYATSGDYTVTLTVNGPGGSATVSQANYIVASPAPIITATLSGSNFVLSGTNCPAGVQYRILTTSSLTQTLATWTPVSTNTFLSNGTFTYSNPATNSQTYFRLVSP